VNNLKNLKILFLEDNLVFAEHTIYFLELYVKEVIHCTTMEDALTLFNMENIDIIISDLKVEDGLALHFIELIRENDQEVPIVVLSAHKDEEFLLQAIPLGLISYEVKPINFTDFKILLNKCAQAVEDKNRLFIKDDTFYDYNKKSICKNKEEIILSRKESLFVELLIKNKNSITTKDDISNFIWENEIMSESALKNFLLRVRKKLGKNFFYTIQNIGYRL
jgi:DNA-binding response OmpR family regulator